jgi:hypothetical protein
MGDSLLNCMREPFRARVGTAAALAPTTHG